MQEFHGSNIRQAEDAHGLSLGVMPVVMVNLVHHLVVLDLIPPVDGREKLGLYPWGVPVELLM